MTDEEFDKLYEIYCEWRNDGYEDEVNECYLITFVYEASEKTARETFSTYAGMEETISEDLMQELQDHYDGADELDY